MKNVYFINYQRSDQTMITGVNIVDALTRMGHRNVEVVPKWRGKSNGEYLATSDQRSWPMNIKWPDHDRKGKSKILYVDRKDFFEWLIFSGSDQEMERLRIDIGDRILQSMRNGSDSVLTIEELFDELDKDLIPLRIVRGFKKDDAREIGDLDTDAPVVLYKNESLTLKEI